MEILRVYGEKNGTEKVIFLIWMHNERKKQRGRQHSTVTR